MSESVSPVASQVRNAAAPDHLPAFFTSPGETDVLMVVAAAVIVLFVLMFGIIFFRLHTLPERIAHKGKKLQFEIVAVLGLLALFTHMHIFWVAGLLLALVDIPDFGGAMSRIAGSTEKIAGSMAAAGNTGNEATGEPELAEKAAPGGSAASRSGEVSPTPVSGVAA